MDSQTLDYWALVAEKRVKDTLTKFIQVWIGDRAPTLEEIANDLGLPVEVVLQALEEPEEEE